MSITSNPCADVFEEIELTEILRKIENLWVSVEMCTLLPDHKIHLAIGPLETTVSSIEDGLLWLGKQYQETESKLYGEINV
jgi:hypothetical protein